MEQENLAAIDLGTNSCRIRIVDNFGNVVFRQAQAVKLGEGLYKNSRFTPEAIQRGIDCLKKYAEKMENYNVRKYRAVATASCRMAQNGAEFVQKVKDVCGIKFDVISPREEAILNLKGARLNVTSGEPYILVYDLGGGSTELTLATNEENPKVIYTISIPWGARNSSEAFDLQEYNLKNALKLKKEISAYVLDFAKKCEFDKYKGNCCCVATSSTPLRLFNMVKNTERYSQDFADGLTMDTADISKQVDKIYKSSVEELAKSPYVGENRASIIISACVIFRTIYEDLKINKLMASLKGAQEAIIQELKDNGKVNAISKDYSRS